jgi:spermidine/putrescine transport system permease protein
MNRSKLKEFALTLPSLGWMAFFFIFPALLVYSFAFKEADETGTILPVWSLQALHILLRPTTLLIALRTVVMSFLATATCIALALPAACYIAFSTPKRQRILLLLIVIPLWSCFLVRIFAWKTVLHPEGILKQTLLSLGLIRSTTNLLYNNIAVFIVMVYSYLPFAIIPLYSAASKFNLSLFEAAMDLGATQKSAFIRIFLPFMRNALLTATLLVLIPTAGAYVIPEVIGGQHSEMLGNMISRKVFIDRDLPQASALSLLLSCIIFLPALLVSYLRSNPSRPRPKRREV